MTLGPEEDDERMWTCELCCAVTLLHHNKVDSFIDHASFGFLFYYMNLILFLLSLLMQKQKNYCCNWV